MKKLLAVGSVLTVAACQTAAPPPAGPAPTAPPVQYIPRKPLPPGGAASSTVVPPIGVDGVRVTPNRGLSTEEHIWNFRVALNVAALNCRGGVWEELAPSYNNMLKNFKNTLRIVNSNVDKEYRSKHGRSSKRKRDSQTTELYNYFALPAVKSEYCNTALQKSREVAALPIKRQAFRDYAIGGLNDIDKVFVDFYNAYAQYEIDLAEWEAKYGSGATTTSVTSGT